MDLNPERVVRARSRPARRSDSPDVAELSIRRHVFASECKTKYTEMGNKIANIECNKQVYP